MKKIFNKLLYIILSSMLLLSGCKDFLVVEPNDSLTGNNFYKSKADIEANVAFIYSLFFQKINETWMMGATGEARSGEVKAASNSFYYSGNSQVLNFLGVNDLNGALDDSKAWAKINFVNITKWGTYYQVIQSCNILIDNLQAGVPGMTDTEIKRYIAEAKFFRNFTYYWMVRLYGDVVYYTQPYLSEALPREDMVTVIQKCIADLTPEIDNIAWDLGEPALKGSRASRGSIVALLMHMNMWNAGFDSANKNAYYEEVARLGKMIVSSNAYRLLPMTDDGWGEVIKGRSDESLFEFYRSINYSDANNYNSPIGSYFLRWPYQTPLVVHQVSQAYYTSAYMESIFPSSVDDKRKEVWFEDMLSNNGNFLAKKFAHNVYATADENTNPDNTFLIFRYADAILLWAEALANLQRYPEAIEAVNIVRMRAEAPAFNGDNSELADFIFAERERELFAEGVRWFDLIRTKKVIDGKWVAHRLTMDQFDRRAWTWPIHREALNNNPKMVLNTYWLEQTY